MYVFSVLAVASFPSQCAAAQHTRLFDESCDVAWELGDHFGQSGDDSDFVSFLQRESPVVLSQPISGSGVVMTQPSPRNRRSDLASSSSQAAVQREEVEVLAQPGQDGLIVQFAQEEHVSLFNTDVQAAAKLMHEEASVQKGNVEVVTRPGQAGVVVQLRQEERSSPFKTDFQALTLVLLLTFGVLGSWFLVHRMSEAIMERSSKRRRRASATEILKEADAMFLVHDGAFEDCSHLRGSVGCVIC